MTTVTFLADSGFAGASVGIVLSPIQKYAGPLQVSLTSDAPSCKIGPRGYLPNC